MIIKGNIVLRYYISYFDNTSGIINLDKSLKLNVFTIIFCVSLKLSNCINFFLIEFCYKWNFDMCIFFKVVFVHLLSLPVNSRYNIINFVQSVNAGAETFFQIEIPNSFIIITLHHTTKFGLIYLQS